jgi:hypothetical protein
MHFLKSSRKINALLKSSLILTSGVYLMTKINDDFKYLTIGFLRGVHSIAVGASIVLNYKIVKIFNF